MEGEHLFEPTTVLDKAESDVYQRWINELQQTQTSIERYDGPVADISGTHELAAVVPRQINQFPVELPG